MNENESLIHEALRIFHPGPRPVVEIRALNVQGRRALSEVFGNLMAAASRAAEWDAVGAAGVYFTANELRPDLAGRKASARKEDVAARHWLLVDVDPARPVDTSSSEDELRAAWSVLDACRATLEAGSLSGAVVGCSGNGWHLCYPIDLPNDDASQELVKGVLKGLQAHCGTEAAKVDTSCHDAPRIWKLYATTARKGQATGDRPHRRAWLVEGEPWAQEAATVNTDLLRLLLDRWRHVDDVRKGRPAGDLVARARAYLARMEPAVSGQHGHDRTFHAACVLTKDFGLGADLALEAIQEWNARCQPPWTLKELRHKIADAARAPGPNGRLVGANGQAEHVPAAPAEAAPAPAPTPEPEPWEQPIPLEDGVPPEPFPLEALPPGLRRFVEEGAWALNCPPDFVAVPLLVAAGACVGNSTRLVITRTHTQGAVLFAGIVGLASSGKSPALELVLAPLEDAQQRFYEEWEARKAAAETDRGEGIAAPDEAELPPLRQLLVDEATTEAIAKLLQPNPRGVLMPLDEVAALVSGLDQYKAGGKGNDRQFYLRLWPQATVRVHRVKHEGGIPLVVRRPFVGIVGGIQPSVIQSMRAQQEKGRGPIEDGFLDRWLWGYPAPLPAVGEQWREVSEEAAAAWARAVQHLLDLPPAEEGAGVYRPRLLGLSATGRMAWKQWTDEHALELNDPAFPAHLAGPWGKFRGYCGRLALILHLLWEACEEPEEGRTAVGARTLQRAAVLVRYFKGHARRVYKALGTDPRIADARKVLSWLRGEDAPTVSRRDLWRGLRYQFGKPEDLAAPLALLQQLHYLRKIEQARRPTGRPASPLIEINPLFLRTKDTKDET